MDFLLPYKPDLWTGWVLVWAGRVSKEQRVVQDGPAGCTCVIQGGWEGYPLCVQPWQHTSRVSCQSRTAADAKVWVWLTEGPTTRGCPPRLRVRFSFVSHGSSPGGK